MSDKSEKFHERSIALLETFQKLDSERPQLGVSLFHVNDLASRVATLVHAATGSKSNYAENLRNALKLKSTAQQFLAVGGVLQAFHIDLANGHLINVRQEIESIVISEILGQAQHLTRAKGVHPAAVVLVACAGLEEFLRNWCELRKVSVPEKARSISRFAAELRNAGEIDLPVERKISSWADYRNDAAHGANWSKITPEISTRLLRDVEEFVADNSRILG